MHKACLEHSDHKRFTLLRCILLLSFLIWFGLFPVIAQSPQDIHVGQFSQNQPGRALPPGWQPLTFTSIPNHTQYELVSDNGIVVVRATTQDSSSGLTREMPIDPKTHPIVQWRWKVKNVFKKGDATSKSGDDYPARLYITFEYDSQKVGFFEKIKFEALKLLYGQYPPVGAISYIWASKSPLGADLPNAYTDHVHMFVVQSGPKNLNKWLTEERNVYEDYKKAFGEEPPAITGVALLTDSDNTKESAVAYYGDIVFKHRRGVALP